MKSMMAEEIAASLSPSITTPNGDKLTSINDIADDFLNLFSRPPNPQTHYANDDDLLEPLIRSHISNNSPNNLNCHLSLDELEQATRKNKSKAMGPDLIHNEMLKNLSPNNKENVLLLFNTLYSNVYVPEVWKKAIVIPLPKPGKPSDYANSYRPIRPHILFLQNIRKDHHQPPVLVRRAPQPSWPRAGWLHKRSQYHRPLSQTRLRHQIRFQNKKIGRCPLSRHQQSL